MDCYGQSDLTTTLLQALCRHNSDLRHVTSAHVCWEWRFSLFPSFSVMGEKRPSNGSLVGLSPVLRRSWQTVIEGWWNESWLGKWGQTEEHRDNWYTGLVEQRSRSVHKVKTGTRRRDKEYDCGLEGKSKCSRYVGSSLPWASLLLQTSASQRRILSLPGCGLRCLYMLMPSHTSFLLHAMICWCCNHALRIASTLLRVSRVLTGQVRVVATKNPLRLQPCVIYEVNV
jgi:hypothetical protein